MEGLPEGVIIINKQGDDLKFINKKLKQTFDVSSFIQNSSNKNIELEKAKKSIEEILDELEGRSV